MERLRVWEGWCANATGHAGVLGDDGVLDDCFQDLVVYSGSALVALIAALVSLIVLLVKKRRLTNKSSPFKPLCMYNTP